MPDKHQYLCNVPRIYDGLDHLLKTDPVFGALGISPGAIRRDYIGPGFPGLVRIVIGQQVSVQAADSLWRRFEEAVPSLTPGSVLILGPDDMRRCGLSHQKARYIRGLAAAVREKRFDPQALAHMSDAQVYEAVTALDGFGHWSAEMFMIFGLARPDIWPAGDLGIQEGLRLYAGRDDRPDLGETQQAGKAFAPYRTAAALLLWYMKGAAAGKEKAPRRRLRGA